MAKAIFKFPLEATDLQEISIQKGAEILTVQTQHGIPQLWAVVDPQAEKEVRAIRIVGTGHFLGEELTRRGYIGTFQIAGGSLVFHVFEVSK